MRNKDLQAIVASIYYLATEAVRANLPEVGVLLTGVLRQIDALIRESYAAPEGPLEVVDSDLLTILELLQKVPAHDRLALEEILDTLESCEAVPEKLH